MARGAIYAGTVAAPGITRYQNGLGIGNSLTGYAGVIDGRFEWKHVAWTWTPLVAWAAIDYGLSKFGVWRRAGKAMKGLGF